MQRALLAIHFMMLLKKLLIQNILQLGKIYWSNILRKLRYLVKCFMCPGRGLYIGGKRAEKSTDES